MVKNSMLLFSDDVKLYGKTGTGMINDKNVNGWFIGFIEKDSNVYFFASNINGKENAKGSEAFNITLSILNDRNIFKLD